MCEVAFLSLLALIMKFLPTTIEGTTHLSDHSFFPEEESIQDRTPYFTNHSSREVYSAVGRTAELHCHVRHVKDKAVSWIRKRDLHVLSVGVFTYTREKRFKVKHQDGTDTWTLQIHRSRLSDSGLYECQVNTEPKLSLSFSLEVLVPEATILGSNDLHLESGSTLNLTCTLRVSPSPDTTLQWFYQNTRLNYTLRGGVSITVDRSNLVSSLLIYDTSEEDSGKYSCVPSSSKPASVMVHIISGDNTAAMHHGENVASSASGALYIIVLLFVIFKHYSIF